MDRYAVVAIGLLVAAFPLVTAADCDLADPHCVTFIALGSLDGGAFQSTVSGISGDGLIAVGTSISQNSTPRGEGFLWSQPTGMQGLGSLAGGVFQSRGTSIH